jgi:bla regulator protein BlaR1
MKNYSNISIVNNTTTKTTTLFRSLKLMSIISICMFTTSIVNANTVDHESNDKIVRVLSEGNLQKIEKFFDNNLDINHNIDGDGTPLIIAVKNRNITLVKYLLDRGANINKESIKDGNPIIAAALSNNIDMVKYLYQHGADIDAIVEFDETALISASRAGYFKVVKFLVEQGADVNLTVEAKVLKGTELRSPLNGAKTSEIREFLINNGARS